MKPAPARMGCAGGDRVSLNGCGDSLSVVERCSENEECVEIAGGSECVCRNQWEGESCTVCPGNWDSAADCGACRSPFEGPNCDCPGNFDPATDCSTCVGNYDPSTDCTTCVPLARGAGCDECVGNRDPTTQCTTCLGDWVDRGDHCNSCASGWELHPQRLVCEEFCGNGVSTASESCDDGNDDPLDGCDSCTVRPFLVDATSQNSRSQPSVAAGNAGFVVVWKSDGQDGDRGGIFGRVFDPDGNPAHSEINVTQATAGDQRDPEVVMADSGRFVVSWRTTGVAASGVFARRFGQNYQPVGNDFQVDTSRQALGAGVLAGTSDGRFAISWSTISPSILTRIYSSAGGFVDEVVTWGPQNAPMGLADLAMSEAGDVMVVWAQSVGFLGGSTVSQAFFASSASLSSTRWRDFYLDRSSINHQGSPRVALSPTGDAFALWTDSEVAGDTLWVRAIPRGAGLGDGVPLGVSGSDLRARAVALMEPDQVAFAWTEADQTKVQIHDRAGFGFRSSLEIEGPALEPAMASTRSGGLVVVWRGADREIYAQRFDAAGTPLGRKAE